MNNVPQTIYCVVRAVGDGMESSNFCFINFNGVKNTSAHPLHHIEDRRYGYSIEMS